VLYVRIFVVLFLQILSAQLFDIDMLLHNTIPLDVLMSLLFIRHHDICKHVDHVMLKKYGSFYVFRN